jgi:hypothetical protein
LPLVVKIQNALFCHVAAPSLLIAGTNETHVERARDKIGELTDSAHGSRFRGRTRAAAQLSKLTLRNAVHHLNGRIRPAWWISTKAPETLF